MYAAILILIVMATILNLFFIIKKQGNTINALSEELKDTLNDFTECKNEIGNLQKIVKNLNEDVSLLSNPSDRDKKIAEECDFKWQVAMLEQSQSFHQKLEEAYQKACESISFHTIDYKKTIQKNRRKEYRKKNPKRKSLWSSIDD